MAIRRVMQWMSSVAAGMFLVAGCAQPPATGATEPEQLYNTEGLEGSALFDAAGTAAPVFAEQAFVRVGIMAEAAPGTVLEGRIAGPDGRWSDWQVLDRLWSEGDAFNTQLDASAENGTGFQLRLVAGPAPGFLLAEAIERIGENPDAAGVHDRTDESTGFGSLEQALGPSSMVYSRADWGARAPQCNSGSHTPTHITIHHTDTPLNDSLSPEARLRQIQEYHMYTKGWCDIGYHFLVDRNGGIWQGRNETIVGAHVLDHNTNNVGISFMGNYNNAEANSAQINRTGDLIAWLGSQYPITLDSSHLFGHRDFEPSNDCPGHMLYPQLGELLAAAGGSNSSGGGSVSWPDYTAHPGKGVLYGYVVPLQGNENQDPDQELFVAGARVWAETGESTTTNSSGYFELWLSPGNHYLRASASGYLYGGSACDQSPYLASGDLIKCDVYMEIVADGADDDWCCESGDEELESGCSTPGGAPAGTVVMALLVLVVLGRARRRR